MQVDLRVPVPVNASMKALPKRKGNQWSSIDGRMIYAPQ